MAAKVNIFITGATGYLGGTVLSRLLKHKNSASFHITALVRTAEKADKLKTLGINTVIGSYTDEDLTFLTKAASQADVIFAIADSDQLPAAKAILAGMNLQYKASGKAPVLIHTSGTAIITDDARGMHADHIAYSDLQADKLEALPITVPHRDIDIPIMDADEAGYIKAYIITPGTIFGYPNGVVADLGIQNKHSVQMPYFIKASLHRKQGGYFGKGLNKWPAVDVGETADLYIILLDAILANPEGVPRGYYFVENCQYSAIEAATAISEALVDLGIGTSCEPSAFSEEEKQIFGPMWPLLANNCHAKADRGRALGWSPKLGKAEFIANLKEEVKFYAGLYIV